MFAANRTGRTGGSGAIASHIQFFRRDGYGVREAPLLEISSRQDVQSIEHQ